MEGAIIMLDKFLHFILKQRLLVILGSIVLLAAGTIAWKNLPIDAFPDVTSQQVMSREADNLPHRGRHGGAAGCQTGAIPLQDGSFSSYCHI
ncbi:MAG: efflux RND transporter permease subunit [Planctomycetota bacterium]